MSTDPALKISYLERRLSECEKLLRQSEDDCATLLKRALNAELRIQEHYQNKDNPDEVDRRLWGGDRSTWV